MLISTIPYISILSPNNLSICEVNCTELVKGFGEVLDLVELIEEYDEFECAYGDLTNAVPGDKSDLSPPPALELVLGCENGFNLFSKNKDNIKINI
jgi:hypothetical protein